MYWSPFLVLVICAVFILVTERYLPSSWWDYIPYVVFLLFFITLLAGLFERLGMVLSVYQDRVVLERGFFSRRYTTVMIRDIRSIDVKQGFMERLMGVGDVLIGTTGTSGYEILAEGLDNPRQVSELILAECRKTITVSISK